MNKMTTQSRTIMFVFAALIFAASCATAPGGNMWRRVKDGAAITGKWSGTVTVAIPENPEQGMPATSFLVTMDFDIPAGSPTASITLTVNFEQFLDDLSAQPAAQAQGITKPALWGMMAQGFTGSGATVTEDYRLIAVESGPVEEITGSDAVQSMEISADGTRLRYTLKEPVSFGIGDAGFKQLILIKNGAE